MKINLKKILSSPKKEKLNIKMIIISFVLLLLLILLYRFKFASNYPRKIDLVHEPDFFGVTFSTKFCTEIGLDWREVYLATLDDLKVKQIRLPIYWDEIESEKGTFDFSKYDYLISEGEKRGVDFIVNIGWRLPRWPECHAPAWTNKENIESVKASVITMLKEVVNHYKGYESIKVWQLENEPYFNEFGICPPVDEWLYQIELDTVRALDDRPIMVSATGELSLWRKEARHADIFGSTLYRVVWNNVFGYIRYPFSPKLYSGKANLLGIPKDKRVIIELQAEPWVPKGSIIYLSEEEEKRSFSLDQFKANLQVAINTNFSKTYLWGVEWWYFKYKKGNPDYWDLAKTLF